MTLFRFTLIALLLLIFVGCSSSETPPPIVPIGDFSTVAVPTPNYEATVEARVSELLSSSRDLQLETPTKYPAISSEPDMASNQVPTPTSVPMPTATPTQVPTPMPTPTRAPTSTPLPTPLPTPTPSISKIKTTVASGSVDPLLLPLPLRELPQGFFISRAPWTTQNKELALDPENYLLDDADQALLLLEEWGRHSGASIVFSKLDPWTDNQTDILNSCAVYKKDSGAKAAFENKSKDRMAILYAQANKAGKDNFVVETIYDVSIGDQVIAEKRSWTENWYETINEVDIEFRSAYVLCSASWKTTDRILSSDVIEIANQLHDRVNSVMTANIRRCNSKELTGNFSVYGTLSQREVVTISAWIGNAKLAAQSDRYGSYALSVPTCGSDGVSLVGMDVEFQINGVKRTNKVELQLNMARKLDF